MLKLIPDKDARIFKLGWEAIKINRSNLLFTLIYMGIPFAICAYIYFSIKDAATGFFSLFFFFFFVFWIYFMITIMIVDGCCNNRINVPYGNHVVKLISNFIKLGFKLPLAVLLLPIITLLIILIIIFLPIILLFLAFNRAVNDEPRLYIDDKELREAVFANDMEMVEEAVEKIKGRILDEDIYFMVLQRAVEYGNMDAVQYALEKGVDLSKHRNASILLNLAVVSGSLDIALYLLRKGIFLNLYSDSVAILFTKAVRKEDMVLMDEMINRSYDVNRQNKFGRTSLHYAFRRGKNRSIKFLLEKGAKCSIRDYRDKTPLDYASKRRRQEFEAFMKEKELG